MKNKSPSLKIEYDSYKKQNNCKFGFNSTVVMVILTQSLVTNILSMDLCVSLKVKYGMVIHSLYT